MNKAEAFKTLRLDQSADGQMVESAYWTLVRQAQGRGDDPTAQHEIDRLNAAYAALQPDGRAPAPAPRPRASHDAGTGLTILDAFADWCAEQALLTRQRWAGRNPEIALVGGAVLVLMFLALAAGASAISVLLVVALICAAIWAPWRRVSEPDRSQEASGDRQRRTQKAS